ncbi:MAG: ornithine cyclodeaminase family protein [Saprospiraceae bacterium]
MEFLSAKELDELFDREAFHRHLAEFLCGDADMPQRTHHDFSGNTLLMMPAWNEQFLGVKTASVAPGNSVLGKPVVHAVYTLFDASTGEPLIQMDGQRLTALRTATASALAARHLARSDSKHLLVIGAGALSPALIRAHAFERPIEEVSLWNRNVERARQVADLFQASSLRVNVAKNLAEAAARADIISCATPSVNPVLRGEWIQPGTHVDLVGSYRPDMREADDDLMRKATVWIDNPAAEFESGDIAIPLVNGALTPGRIKGSLRQILAGTCDLRQSAEEITVFKSVGYALEDLAAATWFFAKKKEKT